MSPPIDPALLSALKPHCSGLGESFVGASGSRVLAEPSGHALFAKCTTPVAQVLGEAHSLNAMSRASSTLVPKVHGFGKTEDGKRAYLITDYKDISPRLSTSSQRNLGTLLAEMHRDGTSENGKFGFEVPTHCGDTEQDNTWTQSWPDFWADRRIGEMVRRIGDKELSTLEKGLRDKVYPLIFGVLKDVKPAIIHGDLWSGNAGQDDNGEPVIFESSYYAHNEAELGIMHMFGGFGPAFFEAYHAVIPRAQPYYEERVLCYELYHHLNHASLFGGGSYRSGAVRIMKQLISFAEREGGTSKAKDKADL